MGGSATASESFAEFKDSVFESEVSRKPQSIRTWMAYIQTKHSAPVEFKISLFERALSHLPYCYKLWKRYLGFLVSESCPYDSVLAAFRAAVSRLYLCPRIWLLFLEFLLANGRFRETRETFNAALQNLPVLQHARVWKWCVEIFVPRAPLSTGRVLFRRYLQLEPRQSEIFSSFLQSREDWPSAETLLRRMLSDETENFRSKAALISEYVAVQKRLSGSQSRAETRLAGLTFLASLVPKFPTEFVRIYAGMAEVQMAAGDFSGASEIYEEALERADSVEFFGEIFEAYVAFLESLISVRLSRGEEAEAEKTMEILERLIGNRKDALLAECRLRTSPTSTEAWLAKAEACGNADDRKFVYEQALAKMEGEPGLGKIVEAYMKWLWQIGEKIQGREILSKILSKKLRMRTLEEVWLLWLDLEEEGERKLELARRAVNLKGSGKLWTRILETEKNFGTRESAACVFEKMVELRLATISHILEFAKSADSGVAAFAIYERGLDIFRGQTKISVHTALGLMELWVVYLTRALSELQGKYFRLSELFESGAEYAGQLVKRIARGKNSDFTEKAYASLRKSIIAFAVTHAKFETSEGLFTKAVKIFENLLDILPEDRVQVLRYAGVLAWKFLGGEVAREVYERSLRRIAGISRAQIVAAMIDFAEIEIALGQTERARALFSRASEAIDGSVEEDVREQVWTTWKKLEVTHGNEETFKELKKVERQVLDRLSGNSGKSEPELLPALEVVSTEETEEEAKLDFEASEAFVGSKPGFVFYRGSKGVGYYRDRLTAEGQKQLAMD